MSNILTIPNKDNSPKDYFYKPLKVGDNVIICTNKGYGWLGICKIVGETKKFFILQEYLKNTDTKILDGTKLGKNFNMDKVDSWRYIKYEEQI